MSSRRKPGPIVPEPSLIAEVRRRLRSLSVHLVVMGPGLRRDDVEGSRFYALCRLSRDTLQHRLDGARQRFDLAALEADFVSVTPLRLDRTDVVFSEKLKDVLK